MAVDADGELEHDYFLHLAARSLGIPWVAWHQWRRSLRSGLEEKDEPTEAPEQESKDDQQTLWVAALEDYSLPGEKSDIALLVLQALLIHGGLTAEELRLVIPVIGDSNILVALRNAGLIENRDGQFTCLAAAYPAIRSGLITAGFPKDQL